jgi:hypothetical protein
MSKSCGEDMGSKRAQEGKTGKIENPTNTALSGHIGSSRKIGREILLVGFYIS